MVPAKWLRQLARYWFAFRTVRPLTSRDRRDRVRLLLELLEDRCTPSADMVADINQQSVSFFSASSVLEVDGTTYLAAGDPTHGTELWKTDGTPDGTVLFSDIFVGSGSSNPSNFTNVGDILYFTADDGITGRELWKTDGTTTTRVADIRVGSSSSYPGYLTNLNGTLYFRAFDNTAGYELWKTDGTTTSRVADIRAGSAGSRPRFLTNVNGTLYFQASNGSTGYELWKTDGTTTSQVADIRSGSLGSNPGQLTNVSGTLYFSATDGTSGYELWKTDGATTSRVADIRLGSASSYPRYLTNINGTLYFRANDGTQGYELWKTDGTATGLVADIRVGSGSSNPRYLMNVDGTLYFSASDGTGGQIWKSDGTTASPVTNTSWLSLRYLSAVGGTLYFNGDDGSSGGELWKTDGATTSLVADIRVGSGGSFAKSVGTVAGVLYFNAFDGSTTRLWKTDGTTTETVKTLVTTGSSGPDQLTDVDGVVYFTANDGLTGNELWKTDGTTASQVVDLVTVPNFLNSNSYTLYLTKVGGLLYFTAWDDRPTRELWKTDGTVTTRVTDTLSGGPERIRSLRNVNGVLFFTAYDEASGYEVWKSDGTTTSLVADVTPGGNGLDPRYLTVAGGTLYFAKNDGTSGYELWKTDGITTSRVADIRAGTGSSQPRYLTDVNGTLYFRANDGSTGYELWKTDGTTTSLVADIGPGPTIGSGPRYLTNANGTLYFRASDGVHGYELWKTDGATTSLVADIRPGSGTSSPHALTNVNGTLYFVADNGVTGDALWKTDGITTTLVADISSGGATFSPSNLTNVNGTLYFTVNDGVHGTEIWKTDGTTAGTQLAFEVVEGSGDGFSSGSGFPASLMAVGTKLYFVARDATHGRELWVFDTATGPTLDGIVGSDQPVNDNGELSPFSSVIIAHTDPDALLTTTVTYTAANGVFANLGGFSGVAGNYTFVGTAAQAQAAIQALVFHPTANQVAVSQTVSTVFTIMVDDGVAPAVSDDHTTVIATSINDAPVGTNNAIAFDEDTSYTFTANDFSFSDDDNPPNGLFAVLITTLPANGLLTCDGVPVTAGEFISATDILGGKLRFQSDSNANGPAYASFTFQVQDDGGTDLGGADLDPTPRTMTVDVNSVNDVPGGTDRIVAVDSLTTYTFAIADFGLVDSVDTPADDLLAVKITALPVIGSLTNDGVAVIAGQFISAADILEGKLQFTADASGSFVTFAFQVEDDGGTAFGGIDLDPTPNTITINNSGMSVTGNPTSQTVVSGQKATFSASATGKPKPTVQWQASYDAGSTWTDIPGATALALTFTATPAIDGSLYRAVFTNALGRGATTAASLTVTTVIRANTKPHTMTVPSGTLTTLTASAHGYPAPSVQWQVSTDRGMTYAPIAGATAGSYSFVAQSSDNGRLYRAVFTNLFGATMTAGITLVVNSAPTMALDPESQTVDWNENAVFVAAAYADPEAKVQWQVSNDGVNFSNIVGATSVTLTLPRAAVTQDGNYYRAFFINPAGQIASAVAVLHVTGVPVVTRQPSTQIVRAGGQVKLMAMAKASPAVGVQWQVSTDRGQSYVAIPGATSPVLTFPAQAGDSGKWYRAVFTNSEGSTASKPASLTVDVPPAAAILGDVTVHSVQEAVFTVVPSGSPAPLLQWQVSSDGGAHWSGISGATTARLALPRVTGAFDGNKYRVVMTNRAGQTFTNAATLTVIGAPVITTQPVPQLGLAGDTVSFTAVAKASPTPSVQWQASTDNGQTFTDMPGQTSTTLAFAAQQADNGTLYRASFLNPRGASVSKAAALTVGSPPGISTILSDVFVAVGQTANLTIVPTGNPKPTVQWQVSVDDGANWMPVAGATMSRLTLPRVTVLASGNQYRAILTNALGQYTSAAATLTVNGIPAITRQPLAQAAVAGNLVSFSAEAKGSPVPSVQWQRSSDGGKTYADVPAATSATLSFAAQAVDNGKLYRAVFSNSNGSVTSSAAMLTVGTPPQITSLPTDVTVTAGLNATFTVFLFGTPQPAVQWQVSVDGGLTWKNVTGARSTLLTLPAVQVHANGSQYRAVVSNRFGQIVTAPVTLTVRGRPQLVD